MARFFRLLANELKIQVQIHNLGVYFLNFFFFVFIAIAFIYGLDFPKIYILKLFLIFIPISLMAISNDIIKNDLHNGHLELLLTIFEPIEIILCKYLSILICYFVTMILTISSLWLFYSIEFLEIMLILLLATSLMILSEALFIFINAMQVYFNKNTNYLLTLIFPFLVPSLILSALFLENPAFQYFLIIISFNMILVPILLIVSTNLIKNLQSL